MWKETSIEKRGEWMIFCGDVGMNMSVEKNTDKIKYVKRNIL